MPAKMLNLTPAQAEENLAHQSAVVAVRHYAEKRDIESAAKKSKDGAAVVIKRWLNQHPGQPLKDGETGWCAETRAKQIGGQFDIGSLSDDQIVELARAGCLVAASKTVTDAVGRTNPRLGAVIDKHRMPGGERQELSVKNEL